MITLDMQQGTPEWFAARRGVVTASNMHRVITPSKLQLAAAARAYRDEMLSEELLGVTNAGEGSGWMQRGSALEADAVAWYELQRDIDTTRAGLLLRDDRRVGYSPDLLVGDDGLGEIKITAAKTHMGYLLDGVGDEYKCQCQTGLYVTGRQWIDLILYNPELPSLIVRIERDEVFLKALDRVLSQFLSYLDESRDKLIAKGYLKHAIRLVAA